jgi:hypothetical protein
MTDNTRKTGEHDRIRINVNQRYELRYWTMALGVTAMRLREAVGKVGPMVTNVKQYLIERIQAAE